MRAPQLLKAWRTGAGLTQEAAAKLVKVRQATWCSWETGKVSPHIEAALKIERLSGGRVPTAAWVDPKILKAINALGATTETPAPEAA